jgi:uncharacterized protein (UPF0333 family)
LRKLLIILTLILLFMSQAGYYFFYGYQQESVKKEMKAQIKALHTDNDYEIIIAEENAKDIVWLEDDEEFCLKGILYDVAKIKKQDGKTYLYCLNDKKEQQLVRGMAKVVNSGKDNATNGKDGKHTLKFQLVDYNICTIDNASYPALFSGREYFVADDAICTSYKLVDSPPPRG